MPLPDRPKIYHIVHVDNLASIVVDGHLWSDKVMIGRGGPRAPGVKLGGSFELATGAALQDAIPEAFRKRPRVVALT